MKKGTMHNNNPKVYFLRVTDNRTKLARIVATLQQQFDQGKRVHIMTPNKQVAEFMDNVLWKLPEESFLPHEFVHSKTEERVAITTDKENLNDATVLFNLCPETSPKCTEYKEVYEILDETDPDKERLSLRRQGVYQSIGLEYQVI